MKQTIRRLTLAAGTVGALALPLAAGAQQPDRRELPPANATRIINMRRALDLTPRQVVQLDSIERVHHTAMRAQMEAMRTMRGSAQDSMRGQMNRGAMRDSATRATMQARMQAMRPQMDEMRRRDSVAGAAAVRVLNDAQRQTLRELQAEERGRQRGMREDRGGPQGPPRGMRGGRGGQQGPPRGMREGRGGQQGPRGIRAPQAPRPDAVRRAPMRRPGGTF